MLNLLQRGVTPRRYAHFFVGSDIHLDTKSSKDSAQWFSIDTPKIETHPVGKQPSTNLFNYYFNGEERRKFGKYPISPIAERKYDTYMAEDYVWSRKESGTLFIAGDIGTLYDIQLRPFLQHCSRIYDKVFFVAGNHEYFAGKRNLTIHEIEEIIRSTVLFPNVHYLSKDTYLMTDQVTGEEISVIGTPLWSFIDEEAQRGFDFNHAYRRMRTASLPHEESPRYRAPTIDEMNRWHLRDVAWIRGQLYKAREEQRKCIVMTHHSPTFDPAVYPKQYLDNPNRFFFGTNLDDLLEEYNDTISVWMFGHTHHPCDALVRGVRLVSNPCGYNFGDGYGFKLVSC